MTTPCTPCQARAAALAASQAQHHAAGAYQAARVARDAAALVAGRSWLMTGAANAPVEITGADLSQLFPAGTGKALAVVGIPAAIVAGAKFLLHLAWPPSLIAGVASVPLVWGLLYKTQFGTSKVSLAPGQSAFTLDQLTSLAQAHGFPNPRLAASVAMAESNGYPCAQGDPHGPADCSGPNGTSTSFGLWQVHQTVHPEYDPASLLDPDYNANAALAISSGGTNWHPWSTYTSGAYLQYYQGSA